VITEEQLPSKNVTTISPKLIHSMNTEAYKIFGKCRKNNGVSLHPQKSDVFLQNYVKTKGLYQHVKVTSFGLT